MSKTQKHIKSHKNKTRKKKNKYINNTNNQVIINYTGDIKYLKNTMISSIFLYFYGNIMVKNNYDKQHKKLELSETFINLKKSKNIMILDYPNIIHTLKHQYEKNDIVIEKFYNFIYRYLKNGSTIFIISKFFNIDGFCYDINKIFNIGKTITGKTINQKYFLQEKLNIININFGKYVSTSIDDLLSHFICFVIFVYLSNSNINPEKKDNKNQLLNKLNLITNDRQLFDKNLFGKTEDEIKEKINYDHIELDKLYYDTKENSYRRNVNVLDKLIIQYFLKEYVVTLSKDTKFLDCNLMLLIEGLMREKNKNIKYNGYSTSNYIDPHFNPNTIIDNFSFKKRINDYSYSNLNELQREIKKDDNKLHEGMFMKVYPIKICNPRKRIIDKNNNELKKYIYLYAFIKYTQMNLHSTFYNNKYYADFFGGYAVEEILKLFK